MLKVCKKLPRVLPVIVGVLSAFLVFLMGGGVFAANTTSIETSVTIKPILTLNIPTNNITMNLDPATHDFDEQDLTVTVGTNNRYGYKLYVSAAGNNTDLVNVADSTKIIPNLTSSYSATNFPANNWGYRRSAGSSSSGNYGVFNVGNNLVSESSGPTNENAATLGFGAKIDYTKPSGLYELDLNFKAIPTVTQEYMQNLDPTTCIDEPTTVIDSRDEKVYTIRRLADGRCWMVENLRFTGELTDSAGTMTLNSATSNVASNTTLSYGELATGSAATADSYTDAKIHVGTVASGSTPIDSSSTAESNIPTVWYNYVAATAGTITGSSNTYESQYDICPKGWRLPDYGEAGGLFGAISSSPSAFNPILGGLYLNGNHSGTHGLWWMSSVGDATNRYRFAYDGNVLTNIQNYTRQYGFYVRCILNESIGSVTTMQQLASMSSTDKTTLKNSMQDSKIYTLRDTRDNQIYTVAKLKDGNLWMSENLNLGAATLNGNLTSSNTNLTTTVTKATFESWGSAAATTAYTPPSFMPQVGVDTASKTPYGMLYNYCAASLETVCSPTPTAGSVLSADICPAGWRIPKEDGTANGDYTKLYSYYNSNALIRAPIYNSGASFSLAGYFYNGVAKLAENSGLYTSATIASTVSTQNSIYLTPTTVNLPYSVARHNGLPVRCLLKP